MVYHHAARMSVQFPIFRTIPRDSAIGRLGVTSSATDVFFFLPMACVLPPGRLEKAGDILLDMLKPIYHRWPKLETSSTRRPRTESFEWLVSRLLSLNRSRASSVLLENA
jgi:hypothetical protein